MSKKRVWDQAGLQELVTVTAPKKIEKNLTKNFSESEVKSRLKALADTIDSRGWVVKHTTLQEAKSNDRLVAVDISQDVPEVDVDSIPDMLDENEGAVSSKLSAMIANEDQKHKAEIAEKMERIRRGEVVDNVDSTAVTPPDLSGPPLKDIHSDDESQILAELEARKAKASLSQSNMRKINTRLANKPAQASQKTNNQIWAANKDRQNASVTPVHPDILNAARNNDLNVATLARQFKKSDDDDDVVIKLH